MGKELHHSQAVLERVPCGGVALFFFFFFFFTQAPLANQTELS